MAIQFDWYVVVAEAQREDVAQRALRRIGVATYIPEHRAEVRRRHRRVSVLRRTYPGYVFVGLEPGREPWMAIDECSAVLGLVGFGTPPVPCRIAPEVVGDVRWRQFRGLHDTAHLPIGGGARLKPDDPAADGLAGRVGRVVQAISDERILVLFGGRRSLLPATIVSRPLDALDFV